MAVRDHEGVQSVRRQLRTTVAARLGAARFLFNQKFPSRYPFFGESLAAYLLGAKLGAQWNNAALHFCELKGRLKEPSPPTPPSR